MIIPFDEERVTYEKMIELFHQFPRVVACLLWLAEGNLVTKTISQMAIEEKVDRVWEYYICNLKVFSGCCQIYLQRVEKSLTKEVVEVIDDKYCYSRVLSELLKMEKKILSECLIGSTYTILSQYYSAGQACGSCWESYDMKALLQVCRIKNIDLSNPKFERCIE